MATNVASVPRNATNKTSNSNRTTPTTTTTTTTTTSTTTLDLEVYSGRYAGETKLQRLLHIAQIARTPTSSAPGQAMLASQAYKLVEQYLKQTGNFRRYHQIFGPQQDGSVVPNFIHYDASWLEDMEAKARAAREVLLSRLSAAQAHLHKDAIRSAHLALAEHDRHYGDELQALRGVLQSKDYCTSRNQTAQVCVLVLELALSLRNFSQVRDYVTKTEHTLNEQQQSQQQQQQQGGSSSAASSTSTSSPTSASSSSRITSVPGLANKIKIASGLERLSLGDYDEAAKKFSSVSWSNHSDLLWNTVTSPEDVATYAGLLSLATASRAQVIEWTESTAKDGLELVPPIRDALRHYGRAEYKACWQLLHSILLPQLEWDIYLRPHLPILYQQICEKCIMEYVRPYQRVSFHDMEVDLGLNTGSSSSVRGGGGISIEDHLFRLIGNGQLTHAKLDTRAQVLIRQWDDEDLAQRQVQKRVAKLGRRVLDDAHAMIIRWACIDHDLIVRAERSRSSSSNVGGGGSSNNRSSSSSSSASGRGGGRGSSSSSSRARRVVSSRIAAAEQHRPLPINHNVESSEEEEEEAVVDDDVVNIEEIDEDDDNIEEEEEGEGDDDDNMMEDNDEEEGGEAIALEGGSQPAAAAASESSNSGSSSNAIVADIPMADANQ